MEQFSKSQQPSRVSGSFCRDRCWFQLNRDRIAPGDRVAIEDLATLEQQHPGLVESRLSELGAFCISPAEVDCALEVAADNCLVFEI